MRGGENVTIDQRGMQDAKDVMDMQMDGKNRSDEAFDGFKYEKLKREHPGIPMRNI